MGDESNLWTGSNSPAIRTVLALQRRDGPAALPVEVILARHPALNDDREWVLDLIYNEINLREERGEAPSLAEYQGRFPELAAPLADLFEVHALIADLPSELTVEPAARQSDDLPTLPGYEITAVLGEGGMGIVYRGRDLQRGVTVAIKTIRRVDGATIARFKQEFRSLLDIAHPNLVTLHELISDGRDWFIVMEYVDGVHLLEYIRAAIRPTPSESNRSLGGQPAALDRLRATFRQVAEGLVAVHRQGRLHRDLKSSNVLVTRDGRAILMDFGLATGDRRNSLDQTTQGDLLGTPAYMAPEQALNLETSEASDWYSVGTMLYETLTGRLPFQGNPLQVLMDKQKAEPPPPRTIDPTLPADLDALCVDLLRSDPAQRPPRGAILDRLGQVTLTPVTPGSPEEDVAAFVGRKSHRRDLSAAMSELARGRTVVVCVRGPSGFGKSALVEDWLRDLPAETLVLAGRCHERESVPYKALDGLIDALSRHFRRSTNAEVREVLPRDIAALAQIFPTLRRVEAVASAAQRGIAVLDPQELRRRSYAAFRELLGRVVDRQPLVLWIDDFQWGDLDSLAVLAEALRPPDAPPFLLVCSYRSEEAEANRLLQAFRGMLHDGIDQRDLDVGPLAFAEAESLARHWLGVSKDDPRAEAIARESGGNPLFVAELARAARGAAPGESGGVVPGGLDAVLWARMADLPAEAMGLLRAVAIAGGPLAMTVARRYFDAGEAGDERSVIAQLRAGRMIRSAGSGSSLIEERIETYHDRVRETVVAHLTAEERVACHHRLALAHEATGSQEFEVIGGHFRAAGESVRASLYLIEAAHRSVEALAFDRAAALYRVALELRPASNPDPEGRSLQVALGDALANAGRGAEAASAYLQADTTAGPLESLELRRKAAMQWLISGYIDKGLETMRLVLQGIGLTLPATPRRALISLMLRRGILRVRGLGFRERSVDDVPPADLIRVDVCWAAGVGLSNVDWVRGADFQTRGLLLALRSGDRNRIGRALAVEAAQSATGGVPSARRTGRLLARARELSVDTEQPYVTGMVTLATGVSSYLESRWRDALTACDEAERLFRDRCTGVAWELDTAHAYALWALSHLGEWTTLARRFAGLITEARERGDLYAEMNLSTYILAIVRLAANAPAEARAEIQDVMARWSCEGYHVQHNDQVWASILVELADGQGAIAWESITRHWPTLARSLLLRVQFIRVAMLGVRARCALAAASAARDPTAGPWIGSAERDAARLDRERIPWAAAQSQMIRAGLASLQGRPDRTIPHLQAARDLFHQAEMNVCAAVAATRLGVTLAGDEGTILQREATSTLHAASIQNPERILTMFAPGWPEPANW